MHVICMCVFVYQYVCMHVPRVHLVSTETRREMWIPWDWSYHVGAGNGNRVLWKCSQCSINY